MDRQKLKEEAIKRMKKLGLMPRIIQEFEKTGEVNYSEHTPLGGVLYWISNNLEWENKIHQLEEEYGFLVYHATHEYLPFGECLSLLIVTKYEEEWEMDWERLNEKDPEYGVSTFSYVINLTDPWCSEFGSICVKEKAGGLIRTA